MKRGREVVAMMRTRHRLHASLWLTLLLVFLVLPRSAAAEFNSIGATTLSEQSSEVHLTPELHTSEVQPQSSEVHTSEVQPQSSELHTSDAHSMRSAQSLENDAAAEAASSPSASSLSDSLSPKELEARRYRFWNWLLLPFRALFKSASTIGKLPARMSHDPESIRHALRNPCQTTKHALRSLHRHCFPPKSPHAPRTFARTRDFFKSHSPWNGVVFQPRDPRTGDWAAFRESAEGVRLLALMDAFGRKVEVRERDFHRLWWRYLKSGSDVEADAERGHATVVDLPPGVTAHSMDMETLATTKMATTQATSTSQHHVLIIFGGNAGEAMLNIHSADSALQRHRRIYVEYPGYGAAYGTVQPSEPLVLAHARAIARWLVEEEGVALDKIVLVGFSIGGGSAVDVAHGLSKFGRRNMKRSSTRPSIITRTPSAKRMSRDKPPSTIAALVLFAPFSSLRAATRSIAQTLVGHRTSWLISRLLMRTFDNHRLIGAVTAPTFYVHGDDDGIIPLEQSVALATEQFKRQEKKMEKRGTASDKQPPEVYMYVVAGADHDDVGASIGWTASFLESLQTTSASANANALHRFDPVTFMHDPHRYVTPYWP